MENVYSHCLPTSISSTSEQAVINLEFFYISLLSKYIILIEN